MKTGIKINEFVLIAVLLILLIPFSTPLKAEYVFMDDGSIVKCRILKEDKLKISVITESKEEKSIDREKILRIRYARFYSGKFFVRKTNGAIIQGFKVDEDRKTYTFRKELYKPDEFTIKREDVLFLTPTSPTGLIARAFENRVRLSWLSPFNKVKYYKIYMKPEEDKDFKFFDDTTGKVYTIKNLKTDTRYYFKVSAVDESGYESLFSKEVSGITGGSIPSPGGLIVDTDFIEERNEMIVSLNWNQIAGTPNIAGYRIYAQTNKGIMKHGDTKENRYKINRLDPDVDYSFFVTAFDNKGRESEDSEWAESGSSIVFGTQEGYVHPLGKSNEEIKNGFGVIFFCSIYNFCIRNAGFGLQGGVYAITGAENVRHIFMNPLFLMLYYKVSISKSISIIPKICAGYSYTSYKYRNPVAWEYSNKNNFNLKEKYHRKYFSPAGIGALTIDWNFWEMFSFQLSAEYTSYYDSFQGEQIKNFLFIAGSVAAEIR